MPVQWLLYLQLGLHLESWLYNFNGNSDAVALTELIPGIMLDIKAQGIRDLNQLSLNRACEAFKHESLVRVSGGDVGLKLVVGRDFNRVLALDFGLCSTAWRFEGSYITRGASSPVGVVLTEMFTVQLELETSDGFIAARVVANYPNFRGFPNIVLIAVKHDLGDALSFAKADKSTDFVFQRKLEITGWEDQGGSEDDDESLASELRNLLLFVCPHVVVLWRELGLNKVLDFKLSIFVVTGKKHACGQPVWQLHRKRVRVLSHGWLAIRPV
jgi:hypothetical protein